jgi:hypothetical protein
VVLAHNGELAREINDLQVGANSSELSANSKSQLKGELASV